MAELRVARGTRTIPNWEILLWLTTWAAGTWSALALYPTWVQDAPATWSVTQREARFLAVDAIEDAFGVRTDRWTPEATIVDATGSGAQRRSRYAWRVELTSPPGENSSSVYRAFVPLDGADVFAQRLTAQGRGARGESPSLADRVDRLLAAFAIVLVLSLVLWRFRGIGGWSRAAAWGVTFAAAVLALRLGVAAEPFVSSLRQPSLRLGGRGLEGLAMVVTQAFLVGALVERSVSQRGRRWRSLESLVALHWRRPIVAVSALRGVSLGMAGAASGLGLSSMVGDRAAGIDLGFCNAGGWTSVSVPGLALLAGPLTSVVVTGAPVLLGIALASARRDVTLVLAVGMVPLTLAIASRLASEPGVAAYVAAAVCAVLAAWAARLFDALTGISTLITAVAAMLSLPLLVSPAPALQLQGWLAALAVTLPLWVSLPTLGMPDLILHEESRLSAWRPPVRCSPHSIGGASVAGFEVQWVRAGTRPACDRLLVREARDGRLVVVAADLVGAGSGSPSGELWGRVAGASRPSGAIAAMDRSLRTNAPRGVMSLGHLVLDSGTREVEALVAGDVGVYRIHSSGIVSRTEPTAGPLGGVAVPSDRTLRSFEIEPDELLVVASRGWIYLTSKRNAEPLGFRRFGRLLSRQAGHHAVEARRGIQIDVARWQGHSAEAPRRASDSLVLCVVRLAGSPPGK